jgi:hypothetical protein
MACVSEIRVALLDEGVEVWRPVKAEHCGGATYRILSQAYDRETERWEFEPGDRVVCEVIDVEAGRILAAVRRAP